MCPSHAVDYIFISYEGKSLVNDLPFTFQEGLVVLGKQYIQLLMFYLKALCPFIQHPSQSDAELSNAPFQPALAQKLATF